MNAVGRDDDVGFRNSCRRQTIRAQPRYLLTADTAAAGAPRRPQATPWRASRPDRAMHANVAFQPEESVTWTGAIGAPS